MPSLLFGSLFSITFFYLLTFASFSHANSGVRRFHPSFHYQSHSWATSAGKEDEEHLPEEGEPSVESQEALESFLSLNVEEESEPPHLRRSRHDLLQAQLAKVSHHGRGRKDWRGESSRRRLMDEDVEEFSEVQSTSEEEEEELEVIIPPTLLLPDDIAAAYEEDCADLVQEALGSVNTLLQEVSTSWARASDEMIEPSLQSTQERGGRGREQLGFSSSYISVLLDFIATSHRLRFYTLDSLRQKLIFVKTWAGEKERRQILAKKSRRRKQKRAQRRGVERRGRGSASSSPSSPSVAAASPTQRESSSEKLLQEQLELLHSSVEKLNLLDGALLDALRKRLNAFASLSTTLSPAAKRLKFLLYRATGGMEQSSQYFDQIFEILLDEEPVLLEKLSHIPTESAQEERNVVEGLLKGIRASCLTLAGFLPAPRAISASSVLLDDALAHLHVDDREFSSDAELEDRETLQAIQSERVSEWGVDQRVSKRLRVEKH